MDNFVIYFALPHNPFMHFLGQSNCDKPFATPLYSNAIHYNTVEEAQSDFEKIRCHVIDVKIKRLNEIFTSETITLG